MVFDESEITTWKTRKYWKLVNLPRKLLKNRQPWESLTKENTVIFSFILALKYLAIFYSYLSGGLKDGGFL